MDKQKLAIIGTVGLPAAYGGFETLTEHLVKNLSDQFEITVYCSGKFYPKEEQQEEFLGAKLKYIPLNANGLQSIPYDIISIFHAAFKADLLLILGVSGCLVLPFVKFFTKKKFFVNIDGIEWKRNKWNKLVKQFLRYSEIFAVEAAEEIITDNKVISDYLATTYNYKSFLIEYGGDQATHVPITSKYKMQYPFLGQPYAFTVCRIEPENNIHVILSGMSENSNLPLVIIGNWSKSAYGEELKKTYNNYAHIHLLDPIYEPEPLNTIRSNCSIYLHGHSAGGTNPSIVEAMNLGLPIIAYDVTYNRESTEHEALFFKDEEDLKGRVKQLSADDHLRKALGQKMLEIAKRRYTWEIIAKKYHLMINPEAKIRSKEIQFKKSA